MNIERKKEILGVIKKLCDESGEAYPMQITQISAGKISFSEAQKAMNLLAEEGLVELDELGFSCTVEYYICAVTDAGLKLLRM